MDTLLGLGLVAFGFILGWVVRSWQFWADEDCANPVHEDDDLTSPK